MVSSSVSHVKYMYVQINKYIQVFHAEVFGTAIENVNLTKSLRIIVNQRKSLRIIVTSVFASLVFFFLFLKFYRGDAVR